MRGCRYCEVALNFRCICLQASQGAGKELRGACVRAYEAADVKAVS